MKPRPNGTHHGKVTVNTFQIFQSNDVEKKQQRHILKAWARGRTTSLTLAQVGVFHVHSLTQGRADLYTKPPRWRQRTPPPATLSVQTQRHSQFHTASSTALTRRKKDNAIYRSNKKKTTEPDRLHSYSRISLTSTIERVAPARDIYFDHDIYGGVIN